MKHLIVCWDPTPRSPAARGAVLRDHVAPALLAEAIPQLSLLVVDEHAQVRSPNPFPLWGPRPAAVLNLWTEQPAHLALAERLLAAEGFRTGTYAVDESVYRTYGDNPHAAPRAWPDGARSPGLTAVTFLYRPAAFSREAWVERWFSTISPVSEAIQPRTRYVRNVVREVRPDDVPGYDGIIEEAFPSAAHLTNPYLFYGAADTLTLARHMTRILRAVSGFTKVWTITTVVMSEWFLRTPAAAPTDSPR